MMTSIPPCRRCATYRRTFLVPRSSPTIRYVSSSFCRFGAVFLAGPSGMVLLSAAAVVCVDRDLKMRDPCRGSRHEIAAAASCVSASAWYRHHEGGQRRSHSEEGSDGVIPRSPKSLALLRVNSATEV